MAEIEHSLELKFGRVLTEAEWREVAEAARKLPYVQALVAHTTTPPVDQGKD